MTNENGSLVNGCDQEHCLIIFLEKAVRMSKRLAICPVTQTACLADLVKNRIVGVLKVFL
jgi:hypothetical protein